MHFRYNTDKLQQIIHALSALTGISMAFLDSQYRFLCQSTKCNDFCSAIQQMPEHKGQCAYSDRTLLHKCSKSQKFECHICHAGLYDACMPIVKDKSLAGYVMMGQIRHFSSGEQIYKTNAELVRLYQEVPCFTEEQLTSLKTLLPEILFQNAIRFDDSTNEITQYIKEHISEQLTLDTICRRFNISKNSLYQKFHEAHDCTVNAYITKLRIDAAQALLLETSDPVYLVAEKVGIDNHTYFCRLFKRHTGFSPGQYRSNALHQNQ